MLFKNARDSNMTCALKILDPRDRGWYKTVDKIMKKIEGLSYEYRNNGVIYITGKVDSRKILRIIAKHGHKLEIVGMGAGNQHVMGPPMHMPMPMPPYPPTRHHQYLGGPPMPMPPFPPYHHGGGYYPSPMSIMPMPYPPPHQYPY